MILGMQDAGGCMAKTPGGKGEGKVAATQNPSSAIDRHKNIAAVERTLRVSQLAHNLAFEVGTR